MAIEVRHDIGGAALAAAGLAGAAQRAERDLRVQQQQSMQLQQLAQQRDMQQAQIASQAQMQSQAAEAAMERTAFAAGLQGQMQEEHFQRSLTQMRERAKVEAEQWDYRYTAQQRQEIQKDNNAIQAIRQADWLSDEEKGRAILGVQTHTAGITPSIIPADPNKVKFPEGREPGNSFQGQDGAWYMSQPDGSYKLMVRPDQTAEYMREQAEIEIKKAELTRQQATEDAVIKARTTAAMKQIDVTDKVGEKIGTRFATKEEVDQIMKSIYPEVAAQTKWWDDAKKNGIPVTDAEKYMDPAVGFAQAYLRKYPDYHKVPEDQRRAWLENFRLYSNAVNAQQQGG